MKTNKSHPVTASALTMMLAMLFVAACTTGGEQSMEDKFATALAAENPNWILYEIAESRGAVTIKVEVSEIVNFQDAKKAVEAIQKVDPKFKGYIDFFDVKTGTVVRKMEIIPLQNAPAPDKAQAG